MVLRRVRSVVLALGAAALVMVLAACSNADAQQAGREFGQNMRSEASNFTSTNRSLASEARQRWDLDTDSGRSTSSSTTRRAVRNWTAPEVRAKLSGAIGLDKVGEVKTHELSRAQLKLADGREVADVVFWDRPGTGKTYVVVRASLPRQYARANSSLTMRIYTNDDLTNGAGCQADPQDAPATWFTSADAPWGPGKLPPLTLDDKGTATPTWTVTAFDQDAIEGKALIVNGQPGNSDGIGSSTRIACGVIGGF